MTLFVILGLMTVVAMALLVPPLVRGYGAAASRADYDMEIYRDQLDELERDVERGVISAEEQASARTEIQRRILAAASTGEGDRVTDPGKSGMLAGFAIMILVPLAAGSLYLGLGSPGIVERPFADRPAAPVIAEDGNPDIEAMVAGLAERLQSEPGDLEGWLMLGRSYGVLERYDAAVTALEHAERLSGGDADVTAMLAEHRVFAAGGLVSPAAVTDFEAALAADPDQPAARFYLALARAQAGDYQTALDGWLALARESPADAPWMAALGEQVEQAAGALGVALPDGIEGIEAPETIAGIAAEAPGPSPEEVAAALEMSEGEQAEMIRAMVARLAARLEDEPGDLDGWRRLGRSYDVLGETELARDAYARAADLAPGDVAALAAYADALGRAAPADGPVSAESVAVYRRLLTLDGDSPVALWHLGLAAAQSGYDDEAGALWRRLLAVLPPGGADHDIVRDAIDGLGGVGGG